MNEVVKINLGRQAFTIAADAHHDLRAYLDAIKTESHNSDVLEEVEIRMAELLAERGIGTDKVILKKDVDFLKEQLGSPKDFKDEDDSTETPQIVPAANRRLFRDTDNALVAGVAAGLGAYFGVDALLFRILFVILLLITFGGGVLLYILLWILVPEAKTASDRLQMAGLPVTVESLKGVAKNADVAGAAKRANASLAPVINSVLAICLKIAGIAMTVFGLGIIFGLLGGLVYFFTKGDTWTQYNIFPVGTTEHVLLYVGAAVCALAATFIIIFGVAIFRRRWPIRIWITGTLAGLLLIGMAVSGALGASVYPRVSDAYNANLHSTVRNLPAFNSVDYSGEGVWDVNFAYASNYYVTLNYFGNPNLATIKTTVNNKVLTIDSSQFDWHRHCQVLCIPNTYHVNITIHSPNFSQLQDQYPSVGVPMPPFVGPGPYMVKPWHN